MSMGGVRGITSFHHMPHGQLRLVAGAPPPEGPQRKQSHGQPQFAPPVRPSGGRTSARTAKRSFVQPETGSDVENWLPPEEQEFEANKIVNGRVLNIVGDDVVVDVGYKSEGIIPLDEWYDEGIDQVVPPKLGDEIQVLLEAVEDESGAIVLSYRKAKRQKEWEDVIAKHKEGDVVSGMVTRKIKGGLLVNIGVNVFLPASQVDIRRPPDIGDYIGTHHRVQDPQDRRGPPQHRRQPPQADRGSARRDEEEAARPRSSRARSARASSRTSPSSARSSTWAASTACCTSPT